MMVRKEWRSTGWLVAMFLLASACALTQAEPTARGGQDIIKAIQAVINEFPNATIHEVELAEDDGFNFYVIEIEEGGMETEVVVSTEGMIIDMESAISMDQAPAALQEAVKKAAPTARITEIGRSEARAEVKNGKIIPLDTPKVIYEAKFVFKGKEREIELAADGTVSEVLKWEPLPSFEWEPHLHHGMPFIAEAAIIVAFPHARIEEVKCEIEEGMKVYEVEFEQFGMEMEVTVSGCGQILEVESEVGLGNIPRAAAKAILAAAEGGKIDDVVRKEEIAVVKSGRIVKLEHKVVSYEAEVKKGDKEWEVEVTAEGKLIEEDEEDAGDDDGDDE